MVHAALAAPVPRGDVVWHAGARVGAGVDDVPAAVVSHCLFLYRHAVADWNHSFGELHIFELFGAGAELSAAGRQASETIRSRTLEKEQRSCGIRRRRPPSKRKTRGA